MTDIAIVVCLAFNRRKNGDGLARFKDCVRRCARVERVIETSGAFDMIVEGHFASMSDYDSELARIRTPLTRFVERMESSFVLDDSPKGIAAGETPLWLPCEGGRRRIDAAVIDKVTAEGDYMRVHVGEWSGLVHQTMASLTRQLPPGFVRLHRSILVRSGFIRSLVHRGRRWIATLEDGSSVIVAQSHVRDLLRETGRDSSTTGPAPSKIRALAAAPAMLDERR